jgi:hypothetical protein
MSRKKRERTQKEDLEGVKFFKPLARMLDRLHETACARDRADNRILHMDQYVSLLLLFMFSPLCKSLRALQEASQLKNVQRKLGVPRDAIVRLGCAKNRYKIPQPVRIVQIECREHRKPSGKTGRGGPEQGDTILGVTDQMDPPAETIGLLFRCRWQIEIFFRFLKHVLGCRHLLSTCQNGIELQMYAAIIACLLIALWTQRKPTLKTYRMVSFYLAGWADEQELLAHIDTLNPQEVAEATA